MYFVGILYEDDIIIYKGMFKNNLKSGKGELYINNIYYKGSFINDLKQGYGTLFINNNLSYK